MYTFVRTFPLHRLLAEQIPAFVVSLLIAETAFRFHSFALEMAAFMITWYAVDGIGYWLRETLRQRGMRARSRPVASMIRR